jgi:hypothetical protein
MSTEDGIAQLVQEKENTSNFPLVNGDRVFRAHYESREGNTVRIFSPTSHRHNDGYGDVWLVVTDTVIRIRRDKFPVVTISKTYPIVDGPGARERAFDLAEELRTGRYKSRQDEGNTSIHAF